MVWMPTIALLCFLIPTALPAQSLALAENIGKDRVKPRPPACMPKTHLHLRQPTARLLR